MYGYILKRALHSLLTLAATALAIFAVTQLLPGDVARIMAGQFASPEVVDAMRIDLGLDRPLHIQFLSWAGGFITGDMGKSLSMELPIAPLVAEATARSAIVAGLAFAVVTVSGIAAGVLAAVKQRTVFDYVGSSVGYVGISLPEFCWGIVFIMIFADWLNLLPSGGYGEAGSGTWNSLRYMILPVLTLAFTLLAHVLRMVRASMIEELANPYVRSARAKGLPERAIILRHVLPNAMLPTIAVLALDVGWLMGGVVTVEAVFSYPGIGRLLMFAIERRDIPLIQACILIIAAIYCAANLVADILSLFVNPKLRTGHES